MTPTIEGSPTDIRLSVHHELLTATRSSGGFSYALATRDNRVVPVPLAATSFPVEVAVSQFRQRQATLLPAIQRTMTRATLQPRFYSARQSYGPRSGANPLWESLEFYDIVDHARMLVFDGNRFVAKVGAIRLRGEPVYSAADLRAANRLGRHIAAMLITAERIERASQPEEGCDLLCSPLGQIEYASEAGHRWLHHPGRREWIRDLVTAEDRGQPLALRADVEVRVLRLSRAASVRYLVQLTPAPEFRAPDTHGLSVRQREVAELLADGCTIAEAARYLGCSGETVRTHVREIYDRLAIGSRAELSRVLGRQ